MIDKLTREITAQRSILDDKTRYREHRSAELEIARLSKLREVAERDHETPQQRERQRVADESVKRARREREERDALEARLINEYKASLPNVSDLDAQKKLPELLEAYRVQRLAEREAQIARHKRTLGARYF
jgi:hypothetical protein